MMKKLCFAFLLLKISLFGNQYEGCTNLCYAPCEESQWLLDANIGYFYPFSKALQDVVSGGVNYELQATYKLNKYFGIFISGDFFYKSGHSTGTHSDTNIWILPVTLGLRASINLWQSCDGSKILQGYCLLGPRWYFVHANNSSDYVDRHNNAQGIGGLGGIGLSYLINQFTLNAFANFSFGNVNAYSSKEHVTAPNTQVGGVMAGAGAGWNF